MNTELFFKKLKISERIQLPIYYYFSTQVEEMTSKLGKLQLSLFEPNFTDLLDPSHEPIRPADLIHWDELELPEALRFYCSTRGRQAKPIWLILLNRQMQESEK